ncbi:MAG: glycosyltransferase [Acidimicrobiales bacterium]
MLQLHSGPVKPPALLVSPATPYPVVTNGCARLISDYQSRMFPGYQVSFLLTRPGDWTPLQLYGDGDLATLLGRSFAFVLFVGFKDTAFTRELACRNPSFCLTDTYPHDDLPEGLFRGILTHRATASATGTDLLLVGGSYDESVFFPDRREEELVLSVGRIHPDKNQLELVRRYREAVYARHGLPLLLVGGIVSHADSDYLRAVDGYVDGEAVLSSIDPADPTGVASWRSAVDVAGLCNRARCYVSAAPKESFGMAMIEAMACGTTCIVNGHYGGFSGADLRPHVYGNVDGPQGSIVDLIDRALGDSVRIDASGWASRFSLAAVGGALNRFIDERLPST